MDTDHDSGKEERKKGEEKKIRKESSEMKGYDSQTTGDFD